MKAIKVILNQGQLKHITKQVRDEGGADYRFDVNLLEGKLSENKWAEMLETIEFKKDYKAWDKYESDDPLFLTCKKIIL